MLEYREPGTVLQKSACYMLALMDCAGKLTFRAVRQPALASIVYCTQLCIGCSNVFPQDKAARFADGSPGEP